MNGKERWYFMGHILISVVIIGVWALLVMTGHKEAQGLATVIGAIAGYWFGAMQQTNKDKGASKIE